MGKKRHGDDSAGTNTPAKKDKVPEFNGTLFKTMLKDPGTAMKGEFMYTVTSLTTAIVILMICHLICMPSSHLGKVCSTILFFIWFTLLSCPL